MKGEKIVQMSVLVWIPQGQILSKILVQLLYLGYDTGKYW